MPAYRLYFVTSGGHIWRAVELDTSDDEAAIQAAEAQRDGSAMELWERDRIVRRFEPASLPD